MDPSDIKRFNGSLMVLSGEHVQIMSHVIPKTTCGEAANAKVIYVNSFIVNTMSPYNVIIGRPTIDFL